MRVAGGRWSRRSGRCCASCPPTGSSFGLHGLDHRTRFASPRRHSELCGPGSRGDSRADRRPGWPSSGRSASRPRCSCRPTTASTPPSTTILAAPLRGRLRRSGVGRAPRLPAHARCGAARRSTCPPTTRSTGTPARSCRRARALIERRAGLWARSCCTGAGRPTRSWSDLERLLEVDRPLRGPLGGLPRRGPDASRDAADRWSSSVPGGHRPSAYRILSACPIPAPTTSAR